MAALSLTSKSTADIEVPNWHLVLVVRDSAGADASIRATGEKLDAPIVTWGRVMAPVWLQLSRSGDAFTASFSPDGLHWNRIGTATLAMKKNLQAGLAGCSSIKVSTTIMFDNVSVPGWPAGR
jgi:regulation of enolase protein 1 (concanavalin A-like superfamily)